MRSAMRGITTILLPLSPEGSLRPVQEYVREEVAECMDGMLDAVDEALPQAFKDSNAMCNTPVAEPAQTSVLLPAPRWAPQLADRQGAPQPADRQEALQLADRQDASLQTQANGRSEPVTVVNSTQCAPLPAEASELEQFACDGAKSEVTADVRAGVSRSGPPKSQVHSFALEAASGADQRNTSSQLVEGNGYPPAGSTSDATHGPLQRQQSPPLEEQEQPRLPQLLLQQQQDIQPQLQRSALNEPCVALLPPPTFALSSRPVTVDANGPDAVKTEALLLAPNVLQGPSVPDSAFIKDSPVAAVTVHPGTDDDLDQQHDGPAHWWPEQTAHQRTASARPDVANGRGDGPREPKYADAMRNGCTSSPSAGGNAADGRRKRPAAVRVVCGGLRATLDLGRMVMVLPDGREMSGNEFERVAGKASAKKWKARTLAHRLDAV